MIIEIKSAILLILANSVAWFVVIFLTGFLLQKVPASRFHYGKFPFRSWKWESRGKMYEKYLRIKKWKDLMPEAGGVFKGFGKRHAEPGDSAHLKTFVRETCRAETVHYTIMAALPLFLIWNPPAALLIMLPIVLACNVPCIVIQRYNRPRLINLSKERRA